MILEDDWFVSNTHTHSGNLHLLSAFCFLLSALAWLDGLELMKVIESAAEVRAWI